MKSVKSLIDRRQEIKQQLHAIAMRQPQSQTGIPSRSIATGCAVPAQFSPASTPPSA